MKRTFHFLALSALILAGCAKSTPDEVTVKEVDHPITFNAVNYITKTKGTYEGGDFGAYAWSAALTKGDFYMENVKVSESSGKWLPAVTYYWPKDAALDFESYSPYSATPWVTVTEDKLTGSIAAGTTLVDCLYSDKTIGCTYENSKNGVATKFRHALAQVAFNIKAAFTEYGTGTNKTSWKITLTGATLKNVYGAGSVELNLNTTDKTSWNLPSPAIWTVSGSKSNKALVSSNKNITTTAIEAAKFFVIPQATSSMQLTLSYKIVTTLANQSEITENITKTIKLSDFKYNSASIDNWKINDNITYNISIKPTADSGTTPGGSSTPEDVVITFDPSTEGWNNINVTASLQI